MSFILEALRKSEHERQRQAGPIVVNPYTAPRRAPPALPLGWIAGIAALLLVNLIVVLLLMLRDKPEQAAAAPTETPAAGASTPPAPNIVVQVAAPTPADPDMPLPTPDPVDGSYPAQESFEAPGPAEPEESLPTVHELNLQGADALPALRMDILVYSRKPAERFVSINSHKYREGDQTREGLLVERITANGVILNRKGLRFLLTQT